MTSAQSDPLQGLPIERQGGTRRPTNPPIHDPWDAGAPSLHDLEFCVEWQVEATRALTANR